MLRPPSGCSTLGVDDRIRVPCPAARTTTAATAGTGGSCGITDLLRRRQQSLRWGTRTRTETARLQRPAGCRLPHPPPTAPDVCRGGDRKWAPAASLGPPAIEGTRRDSDGGTDRLRLESPAFLRCRRLRRRSFGQGALV